MDASDRRKRVAEEAAEWWVTLQGDVSRAQREQYVDWLRESSVHVAEMLHVAQVHGALEEFQRWSRIPIDGSREERENIVTLASAVHPPEAQPRRSETRPRRRFVWTVAAALLVITSTAALLLFSGRGGVIQTERGERREVALADGSVVQVDPETRLRIKYEEHVRRVFLDHGRALFHVAKNTERPFLVESNNTTVRAVGTAFAVEQQDDESVLVTVAEGKVAVFPTQALSAAVPATPNSVGSAEMHRNMSTGSSAHPLAEISSPAGEPRSEAVSTSAHLPNGSVPEIYLTANQQVSVGHSGSAEAVHAIDSGRALAWAEGRLIFENSSVGDAVQQFNRYNRIQIVVNDTDLAHRPISGVFSAADPESFAAFLQSVARVRVTHSDNADITIDAAK
jgi:transmembrane sensor